MKSRIIEFAKLQQHPTTYAREIANGSSFVVVRRSQPLFKIVPLDDEEWEEVIDFTKIQKGGVKIKELLQRL